jgi:L-glutamine-phosphate cytidylyltransferase
MKAIILAAGRGSRMGPLTEDAPKCLVPLAGRPLLAWQVDALQGAGISQIGVVCGYRADLLADRGLTTFFNPRWADTNMVMTLTHAAEWLRQGPVVVSYSDIFYPTAAVTALMAAKGEIALTYDPDWLTLWSQRFSDPLSDAETFRMEGPRVIEIGRRTTSLDDIRGQYMGLLKFEVSGWAAVEAYLKSLSSERRDRLDMTSLLAGLINSGQVIEGVAVEGQWGEVDSAEDLALCERMMASETRES